MFDPNKQPINDPKPELAEVFGNKIESEPDLDFLDTIKETFPETEIYLVGGMVRDILLTQIDGQERLSKDYDFVARKVSAEDLKNSLQKMGRVDLTGRNFGVLKFNPKDSQLEEPIDIAQPRTDFAEGTGGYRDVEAKSDPDLPLEADLSRRDLTINAIAYDVYSGDIIDIYNGKQDLKDKVIRCVGDPKERFQEDYSRMLRAIRFACRFDFKIEENTFSAIKELMPHINDEREITHRQLLERKIGLAKNAKEIDKLTKELENISEEKANKTKLERVVPIETISTEILKAFKSNPVKALELLDQTGALEQLLPESLELKDCEQPPAFHSEGDVWTHTKLMLSKIYSPEFKQQFPDTEISGEFVLGVLLHDIGKPGARTEFKKDGENKVHFHGHQDEGEIVARHICNRLKLSSTQKEKVLFLVQEHMFLMSVQDVNKVSNNKIAKRFIDAPNADDLLQLFWLDSQSSIRPDGSTPMDNFNETVKALPKIKEIRADQEKKNAGQQFINGKTIMDELKLKPGPMIGVISHLGFELKDAGQINSESELREFIQKHKDLLLQYQDKITGKNVREIAEEILQQI